MYKDYHFPLNRGESRVVLTAGGSNNQIEEFWKMVKGNGQEEFISYESVFPIPFVDVDRENFSASIKKSLWGSTIEPQRQVWVGKNQLSFVLYGQVIPDNLFCHITKQLPELVLMAEYVFLPDDEFDMTVSGIRIWYKGKSVIDTGVSEQFVDVMLDNRGWYTGLGSIVTSFSSAVDVCTSIVQSILDDMLSCMLSVINDKTFLKLNLKTYNIPDVSYRLYTYGRISSYISMMRKILTFTKGLNKKKKSR